MLDWRIEVDELILNANLVHEGWKVEMTAQFTSGLPGHLVAKQGDDLVQPVEQDRLDARIQIVHPDLQVCVAFQAEPVDLFKCQITVA
jgi:hypothetical protein